VARREVAAPRVDAFEARALRFAHVGRGSIHGRHPDGSAGLFLLEAAHQLREDACKDAGAWQLPLGLPVPRHGMIAEGITDVDLQRHILRIGLDASCRRQGRREEAGWLTNLAWARP
jgi:hypothetical protein